MRTYKLTIAYDGTNYQGWQRQSDTDRTIQGILEETLENCIGYQVQIDGSGRTDAGVHASGQTASVVLPGKVDTALFTEKMNGCLPPDIRILDVELVKNGFHRYGDQTRCIYTEVQRSFSGRTGSCKDEGGGRIFDRHTFFCGVYG